MTVMTKLTNVATTVVTEAKPLPKEVQDGLDTVLMWAKIIGGSLAVLGLMILFIGLFFAHQRGRGEEFMGKAGWWLTGAIGLGTAGVLAALFVG
ncbi:hypothetical protein J2W89_003785 [Pseudarthrobacter oxydans]|uniref:hypothetical protein n=1 Tax=Pseudarthrobacter oxydans TaxID=1671 RepID=UPI0028646555|nr:hypothetical protein [Pseudarthrobacter oxydans]MDR6794603.1 hypothetical protein [Pseudarthrobacter oxydans]